MAAAERDSTQDWVLPPERRPPTVFELERRIDVALAVARASEAAALEIGAAALDSAEQARRAAELAERACASVDAATVAPRPGSGAEAESRAEPENGNAAIGTEPESAEDPLRHFTERADRVLARLRAIEQLPQRTG
jgi:hypothetical protein